MPVFEDRFRIAVPPEAVSFFHFQPGAIRRLTPPPVIAQVHDAEPLADGSRTRFTLWFGPLPVRWTAVHSEVDPASGFTDTQERGPLKSWKHTHHWTPAPDGGAQMVERIQYEHHAGPRGLLTRLLFSRPALRLMFAYRRWAMTRAVSKIAARQNIRA